ncbi:MAG: glycine cleavage system protein GcvH [Burkholderiaceae bacterium]|nr:glycine cleavage system protein GcvH [Burkholderiaceae bacterium]
MSIPSDRRYVSSHEWIKAEGDVMLVGITGPAQEQLGDLVFVGDVRVGARLAAGATAGVVESVKAASDIYAPIAGEVIAFNDALNDSPDLINGDPYGTWIFKLKPNNAADANGLLDAAGYQAIADAS